MLISLVKMYLRNFLRNGLYANHEDIGRHPGGNLIKLDLEGSIYLTDVKLFLESVNSAATRPY